MEMKLKKEKQQKYWKRLERFKQPFVVQYSGFSVLHIQGEFIYLMKVSLLCLLVSGKDEQKVKSFLKSCGENVLEKQGPHPLSQWKVC